jgi:myo-inositol-1(or 4)-monophosphatase
MMQLEQLTLAVCAIAKQAGAFIRQERQRFRQESVERKHVHDYVSYVDKQSEQYIVSALRQLLPEAGFITEEGSAGYDQQSFCWVVDPLDGTTNFLHQFPPYAVSIALISGHELLVGVVYEVCADECFYAWQGGGAWLGHADSVTRLHVSRQDYANALVCTQLPYDSDAYQPVIQSLISQFYGTVASLRMLGSAAIALCYVAAGRLDAYVEKYIGRWDYMAGALLVQEAGGRVTNYEGAEAFVGGNEVVATNGLIHDPVCAACQKALQSTLN